MNCSDSQWVKFDEIPINLKIKFPVRHVCFYYHYYHEKKHSRRRIHNLISPSVKIVCKAGSLDKVLRLGQIFILVGRVQIKGHLSTGQTQSKPLCYQKLNN